MFLGLDLSTQKLKAALVDDDLKLKEEFAVTFDTDLPRYGTRNGVYIDELVITSPVEMWVEALDVLLKQMQQAEIPFEQIRGISGSGQQHGSVYWSYEAESLLSGLDCNHSLRDQLCPAAFAFDRSPNWQDSSTGEECRMFEQAAGGEEQLAQISGSKAHHVCASHECVRS